MSQQNISLQDISTCIKVVPNFPKEGIYFRDISSLLVDPNLYEKAIDLLANLVSKIKIDIVAGLESRGFLFGQSLATKLKKGFVMLRKPNKMPDVIEVSYGLEYGKDVLTIQRNLIPEGSHVLIVDDLLATGGSFLAGCELIEKISCHVAGCISLIELVGLKQKEELNKYKLFSLIKYPAHNANKFISQEDELLHKKPVEYFPLTNVQPNDNRIVVFAHPSMRSIADNIVSNCKYFRTGTIVWNSFPDNYPNITFEHLELLENKRVVFIGSLYQKSTFFEQLSVITVLPRQRIKSLDIFLPYFAPGTMERVMTEGTLATAETCANIISKCLPMTQEGPAKLHIFDLHNTVTRFYFSDSVIVHMDSAMSLLKQKLAERFNINSVTIAFPDEGASKRFGHDFDNYRQIICSKVREGDKRIIRIIDRKNWPDEKHDSECMNDVIIVDDLVQSGGTLDECRKALLKCGAKRVSAYVTHAVFPNAAYNKFMQADTFHKFYITNTIPEVANIIDGKGPFEVIKIDNLVRDSLLKSINKKPKQEIKNKAYKYTVYVASENKTKLSATYDAIDRVLLCADEINYKLDVYGVNSPSGVSEQPINIETSIGCDNRMKQLQKYIDHNNINCDILVSIENGIFYDDVISINSDTKPEDKCNVSVIFKKGTKLYEGKSLSEDVTVFPVKFLIESLETKQTVTVGKLIEKAYGYKPDAWHENFDKKISRHDMIENAIVAAFKQAYNAAIISDS
jgi:adenine phosphoribosyltransferase